MIADKAINTHEKVRDFQNRLYLTAKADRKRKFYAMYDKIYRKDILEEAWKRVKRSGETAQSKIIGMRNYYARRFARPWLWKIAKYINYKFTRWYNRKKQRKYRLGNAAKVGELTLQAGLASICG